MVSVKKLPKGKLLYKQFFKPRKFGEIEWYSLEPGYGESYGNYITTYVLKKDLNLLNLGIMSSRNSLVENIINRAENESDKEAIKFLIDPDEQYSGGSSNRLLHKLIQDYTYFDGTYINEKEVDDEDLEGPSEVVLFGDQTQLIYNPF